MELSGNINLSNFFFQQKRNDFVYDLRNRRN